MKRTKKKVILHPVSHTDISVTLSNGVTIYKPDTTELWIEDAHRYVDSQEYPEHFIGLNEDFGDKVGSYFAFCSCGSIAVVKNYNPLITDVNNPSGDKVPNEEIVCMNYETTGKHL